MSWSPDSEPAPSDWSGTSEDWLLRDIDAPPCAAAPPSSPERDDYFAAWLAADDAEQEQKRWDEFQAELVEREAILGNIDAPDFDWNAYAAAETRRVRQVIRRTAATRRPLVPVHRSRSNCGGGRPRAVRRVTRSSSRSGDSGGDDGPGEPPPRPPGTRPPHEAEAQR